MKKIFSILFALALVVSLVMVMTAPVAAEPGTTYYVSATGDDDTGDGTVGNPWRTIQKAVNALNVTGDGDTIMVMEGIYDAFRVEDRANITITSTEGATIATAVFVSDVGGPIEEGWVMAGVYRSENINIEGINFDGTAISEEVVVGIGYLDSTGIIAALTVENVVGAAAGAGVVSAGDVGNSDLEIKGCNISDNDVGIWILPDSTQEIHFNNIVSNDYGVVNEGGETPDATYNWWGDASGPYHPITNPVGSGNPVSNDVDFNPWLEAASVIRTVTNGTINAINEADIIVNVTGTATVIIFRYDSDPHAEALALNDAPASPDLLQEKEWISINTFCNVIPSYWQNNTVLRLELYYTEYELAQAATVEHPLIDESSLRLRWYNTGIGEYEDCSPEGDVEPAAISKDGHEYSGYMWVELRADGSTYPSLAEAQASLHTFGGYAHPSEDFDVGCGLATLTDVTPFALVLVGIVAVWATKRKGKVFIV